MTFKLILLVAIVGLTNGRLVPTQGQQGQQGQQGRTDTCTCDVDPNQIDKMVDLFNKCLEQAGRNRYNRFTRSQQSTTQGQFPQTQPQDQNRGAAGQPQTFPGQPQAFPGQPQPFPGQPQPFPGQSQPGQPQPFPGQSQPGQPQPFPGQSQPGQTQPFPGQSQPGQSQQFPGQSQPGQNQSGQNQSGQNQPGQNQQFPQQPQTLPGQIQPQSNSTFFPGQTQQQQTDIVDEFKQHLERERVTTDETRAVWTCVAKEKGIINQAGEIDQALLEPKIREKFTNKQVQDIFISSFPECKSRLEYPTDMPSLHQCLRRKCQDSRICQNQ